MKKSGTMKKMLTYYKPYMRVFWTDMFFRNALCGGCPDHSAGRAVCDLQSCVP